MSINNGVLLGKLGVLVSLIFGVIESQAQKNVLMIMVDDLRTELGCYGVPYIKTPNIDRLAARSTVFGNAYCNIPVSGASRASLLTGLYPRYPDRFMSFDSNADKDAPEAVPISAWFKSRGYQAISNGKVFHNITDCDSSWSRYPWRRDVNSYGSDWAEYNKWELWMNDESGNHINPKSLRGPFCERSDMDDDAYEDGLTAQKTVEDLAQLQQSGTPFFLAVGFWRPHLPFNAPAKYWDMYQRDSIPLAGNRYLPENLPSQVATSTEIKSYSLTEDVNSDEFHRLARHGYFAAVSYVDAQIGRVLDALDSLGMAQNTVVVLVGDHGWHLGEHTFWGKHNLMRNATKAPMIIHSPQYKGGISQSMAEFVDIYPTICDLAGIDSPQHLQGSTLRPVMNDPKASVKNFVRIIWGNGVNIIDQRYSYSQWDEKARMLYDHRVDGDENTNIAPLSQHKNTVSKYDNIIREMKIGE